MSDDLAERVLDVEVKLAYQDRLVAELDAVVRDLGARVVALSAEVERLRKTQAPAVAPEPA